MKRASILIGAAVLAIAAAAYAADGFNLKRVPKVDQTYTYRLKAVTEVQGVKAEFVSTVVEKVTEVKEDGSFSIEETQKDATILFGDSEMPVADQVTVIRCKPNGRVTELKAVKPDSIGGDEYRVSNLTSFIVEKDAYKAGDKWEVKIEEDKEKGVVPITQQYEVLGQEKVNGIECVKVKVIAKETEGADPASAESTVWIDPSDGVSVKAVLELKKAPIMQMVLNGKMTIERGD